MPEHREIELAFEYVGIAFTEENRAVYGKSTKRFYYEWGMLDESESSDVFDRPSPAQNDRDLVRKLIFESTLQMLTD
jgi:hypothetical protein